MTQNIWNAAKAVLKGSFRIQSYLKKKKKNSYKQLNLSLKQLDKKEEKMITEEKKLQKSEQK